MNPTAKPSAPTAKRQVGTIDLTPSWSACVPVYMAVLSNPRASETARRGAMEEIERVAHLADLYVAARKAGKV